MSRMPLRWIIPVFVMSIKIAEFSSYRNFADLLRKLIAQLKFIFLRDTTTIMYQPEQSFLFLTIFEIKGKVTYDEYKRHDPPIRPCRISP